MFDVIIIGGGIVGCAVAREIAKYDLRVALLEKDVDICAGQSKANTAIIHGGYDAKPGTIKAKYNVLGNLMYEKVCSELEVERKWNTSLVVSFSNEDNYKIDNLMEQGIKNGVPKLEILSADKIRNLEPNISQKATKALLVGNAGIVCPYGLTFAYAENAADNGVIFYRNTPVTSIKKLGDNWSIESNNKSFEAKCIINCAGLYSDVLNNMVSEDKFHITPRRGEYYIVDKKFAGTFNSTIFQIPTKMGKGILVAPTVDGTLLIGPTAEDIEDKGDTRTTRHGLESIITTARKTWEDIPVRSFITTFTGLRAHCDKNDFVLGEAPDAKGFFNAGGVESPGLTSAPAIGIYLAELVADKLNAKTKPTYNPYRKAIPLFRKMSDQEKALAITTNPEYAKIVCRCESVTEAEIRQAIRRPVGARTVDGIKFRVRAGMGRCQSGFCLPKTVEILSEELGVSPLEVTKANIGSNILSHKLFNKDNIERDVE
ncbi:MAG: NAD(P)/FAD-dependent oxidoreductase [Synergistaceae bacterium]